MAEAGDRVAAANPAVAEDAGERRQDLPVRGTERPRPSPTTVLEDEPPRASDEDRDRDTDEDVPGHDRGMAEPQERLARLGQTSASSSAATSNMSATAPYWATPKIAASGSVLTAMIVPLCFIPATCCTAPEIPKAR